MVKIIRVINRALTLSAVIFQEENQGMYYILIISVNLFLRK